MDYEEDYSRHISAQEDSWYEATEISDAADTAGTVVHTPECMPISGAGAAQLDNEDFN